MRTCCIFTFHVYLWTKIQKHLKIILFLYMSVNSTKNLTVNVALSACSQASQWSSHPCLAKRFSDSRANSQQTANFRPKFQTHELACVAAFTLLFQVERSIQRAKEERKKLWRSRHGDEREGGGGGEKRILPSVSSPSPPTPYFSTRYQFLSPSNLSIRPF